MRKLEIVAWKKTFGMIKSGRRRRDKPDFRVFKRDI